MQRHNKNSKPLVDNIINPFNDVSPPSETEELTRAVQELSMRLAQKQGENDRRNRELFKQKSQSNKMENSFVPVAALQLFLEGDKFCITGSVIENKIIELCEIRSGSSSLIEPILKACKNHPYTFRTITLVGLKPMVGFHDKELAEATKDIPLFKQYLSNIGLQGKLRKLFFANNPRGLHFKFRTAITQEKWDKMLPSIKQKIVKMLEKLAVSK